MSESSVPENVSYSDSHEWIQVESDIATIGITDFAQSELGDIVFVELPEVGEYAKRGETFGTVEAVKTVEDLIAPLSGEVLEANETLEEDAEQINKDPYGAGWMIKIRIEDEEQLEELLSPSEYSDIINE
ncbi:MAG: glycine cleavage system protein GcvH [Candidatus Latescibacterota bacterium]|jgi:glycine cleavage system H protein|nr:glycine cleavage system protein GcvH [Candidatus Latescibacterota bacterium]MEE2627376.1 glycine cleavage system protein GcvH [Candidatus Latescibacterota bacterium]MEE2727870.1 glycine cleavage system protein GcvH [Candidatus Latescibacterota bacterium]